MKLTPEQLKKLSDSIEEIVDSAEIQDHELRRVAHADMLMLATNCIESGRFTYEFILEMTEQSIKDTKIAKMMGVEMEEQCLEMAMKRGLMKEE